MLEIRYDKSTKQLTGWWATRHGNHDVKLQNRPNEAIVTLDIPIPDEPLEAWLYDEPTSSLIPNPAYELPQPPRSTHVSVLEDVDQAKVRPARVRRTWEGNDYYYDCFASEVVKDQWLAGTLQVGDHVLVHFDDVDEQIIIAKVFKSW